MVRPCVYWILHLHFVHCCNEGSFMVCQPMDPRFLVSAHRFTEFCTTFLLAFTPIHLGLSPLVDWILYYLPTGFHTDSSSVNSMNTLPVLWSELGYYTFVSLVVATMVPSSSVWFVSEWVTVHGNSICRWFNFLASTGTLARWLISPSIDSILQCLPTSSYTDSSSVNSMIISPTYGQTLGLLDSTPLLRSLLQRWFFRQIYVLSTNELSVHGLSTDSLPFCPRLAL